MVLIVFSGVIILSLFIAFKREGTYHKIISVSAIASLFAVLLLRDSTVLTISYLIFFIMQFATMLYGIIHKELQVLDRISIIAMGLFFTLKSTGQLLHYPYPNALKLSLIIPAVLFLIAFIYNSNMRKELSFMIFWFFYAMYEIANLFVVNQHHHH